MKVVFTKYSFLKSMTTPQTLLAGFLTIRSGLIYNYLFGLVFSLVYRHQEKFSTFSLVALVDAMFHLFSTNDSVMIYITYLIYLIDIIYISRLIYKTCYILADIKTKTVATYINETTSDH